VRRRFLAHCAIENSRLCMRTRKSSTIGNPDASPRTASKPQKGHIAVAPSSSQAQTDAGVKMAKQQKHPHVVLASSSARLRIECSLAVSKSSGSNRPDCIPSEQRSPFRLTIPRAAKPMLDGRAHRSRRPGNGAPRRRRTRAAIRRAVATPMMEASSRSPSRPVGSHVDSLPTFAAWSRPLRLTIPRAANL
jgi:hypothetical protein